MADEQMSTHANAYDQRQYREWMHELPPSSGHRGTTLDVYRNILPETGRLKPEGLHLVQAERS